MERQKNENGSVVLSSGAFFYLGTLNTAAVLHFCDISIEKKLEHLDPF